MMTDTEPTLRVEIEQGRKILLPQFQPSDLNDEQREVYDALRDAGARHHSGAIAANEIPAAQFEVGETVTLDEVVKRHKIAVREATEAFRTFQADLREALTPIVSDLAEASRSLAEWGRKAEAEVVEDLNGGE